MRYRSLNTYLKETYGEKLYKLSLMGATTCPTRDGTLGTRGCIFCSAGGSGEFASRPAASVQTQIEEAKQRVAGKFHGDGYIAYFQAFTNTYGDIDYLWNLYRQTIAMPQIKVLSIATRPDCLGERVMEMLTDLAKYKPVWVELGLQTMHEQTASYIRRGYSLSVFEEAVNRLRAAGIDVIVHLILGLPGEGECQVLDTVRYLSALDIQGVKLQLLHVLLGTDLARDYEMGKFEVMTLDAYLALLGKVIAHLRPDIVIHRLTGDGDKRLLLAPMWSADKKRVLNAVQQYLERQDIVQGRFYDGKERGDGHGKINQ